jgi:cephalosporin hydroxylase
MAKVRNPLPMTIDWSGLQRREHFLDDIVKKNNWSVGVEVGVRVGRTLFYLLDNNPSLKMYAVDIDITQFYSDEIQKKYGNRLVVLEGESSEQASRILEQVDFVFIDASHSTKGVVRDINAFSPLIRNKIGLTGHDIDFPAVQEALNICKIEYEVGPDNVWQQKINV